jgi:lysophospholipase L1-like esterase
MTHIQSFARITAAALLATVLAVPAFAQARGAADFTRFYAIGDSYGAGYESGSLNVNHQQYSWPAIIAKQVGLTICPVSAAATDVCFAQPLVQYPGLPSGESQLTLIGNSVVPVPTPGTGAPLMAGFGRSYNNLAVPGYTVGAALTLTGAEANSGLGQLILRGLGSEVAQVAKLNPPATFIAIWIGGNDFLGAVSAGRPSLLTDATAFRTQYATLLDTLIAAAPGAGMVVGTLPANFAAAPLTAQLPPVIFDSNFKPVVVGGNTIPFFGDVGGGPTAPAALPPGSIVLLSALPKIQQGVGMPPALKNIPPFSSLPRVGEPLTDADIITPAEQAIFTARIADYNTAITDLAKARNIPVADIKGLFDRFASPTGLQIGPFVINHQFVRGGIFSLDGVHPSDIGYALFANEFIKAINSGYSTHIPLASLSQFLQNNDPTLVTDHSVIGVNAEAVKNVIDMLATTQKQPTPARRRAAH